MSAADEATFREAVGGLMVLVLRSPMGHTAAALTAVDNVNKWMPKLRLLTDEDRAVLEAVDRWVGLIDDVLGLDGYERLGNTERHVIDAGRARRGAQP